MRPLACAWCGWVAGAALAAPCGEQLDARTRRAVEGKGVMVTYAPQPAPIPVGRHFRLDVAVCGPAQAVPRVDAFMPAHGHGMNYRPTVMAKGAGRYEVQGMMFHMPGRWRLVFEVDVDGHTQRLAHEVEVK